MRNKCLLNLNEELGAKITCELGESSLKICPINSVFIIYFYHGNLEFNEQEKRFDSTSMHLQCGLLLGGITACPLLYVIVAGNYNPGQNQEGP